jgi:Domain of unknown function (DUF2017)
MGEPMLVRLEDGSLAFVNLEPWLAAILFELPGLLHPDQPDAVKDRLYPYPADEEEAKDEWRRLVHPDLFALIASARDVVQHDLARVELGDPDDEDGGSRLVIPHKHIAAWISAVNAARLTLAAANDIEQDEMDQAHEGFPESLGPEKIIAITRINLLGWVQEMLILAESPPPPEDPGNS